MGTYVSPFGGGSSAPASSGGKTKSTNYISPFAGSQYTEDYWKKKQDQDQQIQKQKQVEVKKQQVKDRLAQSDADVQKSKDAVWNPLNILGDIGKAVGGAANATGKFAKDVVTGVADQFKSGVDQANLSARIQKNSSAVGQGAVDKLKKFVDQDEKAGLLTKQQADAKRAHLQSEADKTTKAIGNAEKKVGVKFDQDKGAIDFLSTVANLSGLDGIGKAVFEKVAATATKRLGRNLTKDEAENLAAQTKKTVPAKTENVEPTATKPVVNQPEINGSKIKPTIGEPTPNPSIPVSPTVVAKAVDNSALENTLFTAAKTKAEERLGRELKPEEVTKLTNDTKQIVAEKMPTTPAEPPISVSSSPQQISESTNIATKPVAEPSTINVNPEQAGIKETPVTPKVEGDTVSGNSARIEQHALEKKLTDKMGDLPQYKSINMKEQAKEAVDLISTDRQKAIDIIDGKVNAPGNLKAQSVHQALEDIAVKEGDGALLTKLAKSHVNTELSESAQNLRIAAERDPHSPVEQIRQIRDARVKAAERRSKTTVSKETTDIKKKVDAATPKATKQDWNSFVKELTC